MKTHFQSCSSPPPWSRLSARGQRAGVERGRGFYVRWWRGGWQPARRCPWSRFRGAPFQAPYVLRIDRTGDYPRAATVPSGG